MKTLGSVKTVTANKMDNFKSIPYRLIEQNDETNSLVIVLPGAGYTTQAPLLHFTTGVFYSKGFDVLHINYKFSREEMPALNERDFSRELIKLRVQCVDLIRVGA